MGESGQVIMCCAMCPRLITTTETTAFADAMDHALDVHRLALLADPDGTERLFTITSPGKVRPVQRATG